jgi:hypothetical protein
VEEGCWSSSCLEGNGLCFRMAFGVDLHLVRMEGSMERKKSLENISFRIKTSLVKPIFFSRLMSLLLASARKVSKAYRQRFRNLAG